MSQDYMRLFPKSACYPNQKEAMESIHKALLDQKIVLFEGACGTGKTLSTLVPAIDVAQKLGKVVIIATNVHQQMQQFIEESREIKQKQDLKVAVLKGKKHMCPREEDYETCSVLKENTYELINKEKESAELKAQLNQEFKVDDKSGESLKPELDKLEKQIRELRDRYCSYLYCVARSDMDDFSTWYFEDVRTTEEVNKWAYEKEMCGYELMKRQMGHADLVICNFHHILNFKILANLLGWMDKSVDDIILIFDEAHNLESAARSHSSLNLPEYSLLRAFEEVTANEAISQKDSYRVKDMENLFKLIYQHLKDIYESRLEFGERERLPNTWKDVTICDPKRRDDYFLKRLLEQIEEAGITELYELLEEAAELGRYLNDFYKEQYKQGHTSRKKNSQLLRSAEFFMFYLEHASEIVYYPMLNVRKKDNEVEGRIEIVSCIPNNVTAPILSSFYALVLMSATLQPYQVMKAKLGITRPTTEIAYGITFPEDNRLTIAINSQPLFAKKRDDPGTIEQVTQILNDIIQHIDGNVLVFFQSYHEAKMYKDRITSEEPIFLDEIGISSREVRDDFFKVGEMGNKAIIFSYLWGTLTEGVDYKDGRGRAVVIVGVGYPALNDRMRAIEAAYDHEFPGKGWDYAIQIPTIRKVRQAMGRVIRSPSDYGARILLDGRYTSASPIRLRKYSVFHAFPSEDRDEIIDVEPDKVKFSLMNFFNDMKKHQ
jgi:DNA excision repair protein ERCC-2